MSVLSERITLLRKEKGISVKQAGFEMGLDYKYLLALESCEKKPELDELELLESYYNTTIDYLVGSVDEPQAINMKVINQR